MGHAHWPGFWCCDIVKEQRNSRGASPTYATKVMLLSGLLGATHQTPCTISCGSYDMLLCYAWHTSKPSQRAEQSLAYGSQLFASCFLAVELNICNNFIKVLAACCACMASIDKCWSPEACRACVVHTPRYATCSQILLS